MNSNPYLSRRPSLFRKLNKFFNIHVEPEDILGQKNLDSPPPELVFGFSFVSRCYAIHARTRRVKLYCTLFALCVLGAHVKVDEL